MMLGLSMLNWRFRRASAALHQTLFIKIYHATAVSTVPLSHGVGRSQQKKKKKKKTKKNK
jgi:hypothetical protein